MLEQKIAEAKANKRKRFITLALITITISLVCVVVIFFPSVFPERAVENDKNLVTDNLAQSSNLSNDELRQSYIDLLSSYENNIEPELSKIDIARWDKRRFDKLISLKEEALSKFSLAEYSNAYIKLNEATQFAEAIITDSQKQFAEALPKAQEAYNVDDYKNADKQIKNALMLNNQSNEAIDLSNKIERLPEILPLLDKANTARIENNYEKELGFIKEIIEIVPERTSSVERKNILTDLIANKNFKFNIAKSYDAIEQGNATLAREKLNSAKKIFPNRQEIGKVETVIQELEKNQRFEKHQQAAQKAMTNDDWLTAKQQLQLALQERQGDALILESLSKATSIIRLKDEFEQLIAKPYSLSNTIVASNANTKITEANVYKDVSPDLSNKANELSLVLKEMNNKVSVEVISDNQTNVLVRGVGIVGQAQLKTIQLTPGQYKFEGKRKGYKSKLIDVLIPYDKPSYSITVICDEPI